MVFSSVISFERPYDKTGAPSCGIYLTMPTRLRFKLFMEQLRSALIALNESKYQKNMHAVELRLPKKIFEKERVEAQAIVDMCKGRGVVPIVRGDLGLAVECGAEGILLMDASEVAEARKVLGQSAIIGVDCGNSQVKAEAALEAGVDYVVFSEFFARKNATAAAELSLLKWWSTKTELPAVASGNVTGTRAVEMTAAGAGFIAPGNWTWNYSKGPKQAIYWLQEMIEHALTKAKVH